MDENYLPTLFSKMDQRNCSPFCVGLGRTRNGGYLFPDLRHWPHLLIGGALKGDTSRVLQVIVSTLNARATEKQISLLLINCSGSNFSAYSGMPLLLRPVITEPKAAEEALTALESEISRRLTLMPRAAESLPRLIVVVDEFSPLLRTDNGVFLSFVMKVAPIGRRVGVHLILATSDPCEETLPGILRAHIPSRLALRTLNAAHSRLLLDQSGAQNLRGRDMLYFPADSEKPLLLREFSASGRY